MDFDKSVGPQINFDKSYLCMMTDVCKIKQDQVTLKNTGSTTVTYEWKKIERGDYIPSKKSDGIQRFYCHYPRDTLKPGEMKTFIFSFRSEKPGMFNEEWELLTEPQLLEPAPLLYLSGMATKADDFIEKRTVLNAQFDKELATMASSQAVQETPIEIKAPVEEKDKDVSLEKKFESFNEHLGLYFTQNVYDNFVQVYNMVVQRLQVQGTPDNINSFDVDVEYIEELITRIQNPYTQESLQRKYVENFYKSKKVPTSRAQSYDIFRAMVLNYSEDVIDVDEKVRRDLQLTENLGFEVVPEEQTQEEADAALEELKSKKAEAAKKLKQKPKTEEEEAAELESLIAKTAEELGQTLCVDSEKVKAAEKEIELIKTRWLMQNHLKMDKDAYDAVNRKLSIYDIELGARDVILRLDLDIPLSKFVPPAKTNNEMLSAKSLEAPASVGKDSKLNVKNSEIGSVVSASPLGAEEDYWRQRQILDHSWVKKAAQELRMLMERMVNRVFIIGNLGERHGKIKGENSMKIIQNELAKVIHDVPIHLLADGNKSDFIERKQQDEFADNCIYVVENLNFHPEEFGYIEPAPKVEAPPPEVEEPPKEEVSQPKDSKGKDKSKKEDSKVIESQQMTQEVVEPVEEVQEEPEPVPEPFNAHTIHQFKKNLGSLGEIYINDAPLASLSNSTTTSEIKCPKKVMGMKMTEEMRNIAQFFMKEFPLDIDSIYHKKPDSNLEYYTIKSSAIIGGICTSTSDIIEKILLANSFLDTFQKIFLVGEVGIAAIHALGLETGKVERSADNKAEYDMMKEFFIKLFEKSVEKGVEIKIPVDFVTAERQTLDEITADVAEKEAAGTGQETDPNAAAASGEQQSKPKTGEQTSGANGQPLDISEVQKVQNDMEILSGQGKSGTGPQFDSNFKPNHWTDAQIFHKRVHNIDLEAQINKRFDAVTEKARQQVIRKAQSLASSGLGDLKIAEASLKDLGSVGSAPANVVSPEQQEGAPTESKEGSPPIAEQEEGEENQAKSPDEPSIHENHSIIAFGPKTVYALQEAIKLSFKLFWDGSVCMFFNDTILSSVNNKDVLNTLLEMRTKTNDHEDPPVTLLHGQETEKVLRTTLMRIKIEQQEALEAKKRAAEEYVPEEEDDEENEDEMEDLADESEEKISTFQEDLDIITDFSCFTSSEFTMKIMQGVNMKCMLNLEEHKKPSKEQMEENLSILDAI